MVIASPFSHLALITVEVDIAENQIQAAVEDDGRGFDPGGKTGGTGLASMKERTSLLGGTLTLTSEPEKGARIEIFLPLPRSRH